MHTGVAMHIASQVPHKKNEQEEAWKSFKRNKTQAQIIDRYRLEAKKFSQPANRT